MVIDLLPQPRSRCEPVSRFQGDDGICAFHGSLERMVVAYSGAMHAFLRQQVQSAAAVGRRIAGRLGAAGACRSELSRCRSPF